MSTPEKPEDVVLAVRGTQKADRFLVVANFGERELARDIIDLNSALARKRFTSAVLEALPGLNGAADKLREYLAGKLCDFARCPPGVEAPPPAGDSAADDDPRAAALEKTPADIKKEAENLLEDCRVWSNILRDIREVGVVGENDLAGCIYAIGTSRLLPKPLAGIVRGPSSSGKSYIVNAVSTLFPDECLIRASQMTPQALFYMKPGSLRHKWVVAGERSRREEDEQADCTRALREMISEGRLSKLIPMKNLAGVLESQLIEQEGPIAFTETTTLAKVFDEDQNRALVLVTDEGPKQTKNIIAATAEAAAGAQSADVVRIRAVHNAVQRMLPRCEVLIPFAVQLGKLFEAHRVEARREFPHLLRLIRAITLLHFKQREQDGGRLVATLDDYEIAEGLARVPLTTAASGMSDGAKRFLGDLKKNFANVAFDTKQARGLQPGAGRRTVETWLNELDGCGQVKQVEVSKGRIPAKWQLADGQTPSHGAPPTRKQVEEVWCKEKTTAHMRTSEEPF